MRKPSQFHKSIVFERADGTLRIRTPIARDQRDGETDEDFIARCSARDIPEGVTNTHVIDTDAIPTGNYEETRDRWRFSGGKIVVA